MFLKWHLSIEAVLCFPLYFYDYNCKDNEIHV